MLPRAVAVYLCDHRQWALGGPAIELVASETEIRSDVIDDSAWDVATMPGEGDQPIRAERVRVVAVSRSGADEPAAKPSQSSIQLLAVQRGILGHLKLPGRIGRGMRAGSACPSRVAPASEPWRLPET